MSGTPGDDARPAWRVHDLSASDPDGELSGSADLDGATEREIDDLMAALVALREAESELSDASRRYMDLGTTDMRALHFLIAAAHKGEIATAGALGQHLGISSGSTTKLLDRLVRAGHISRAPHPEDRRAVTILVTPSTRSAAMESIGRQHAGRVRAAVRLTSAERRVVTRFLQDMTQEISPAGRDWAERPHATSGSQDAEGDADAR